MDSELFIEADLVFPRLPFGIVAFAFTLLLDNLCRNSCIWQRYVQSIYKLN